MAAGNTETALSATAQVTAGAQATEDALRCIFVSATGEAYQQAQVTTTALAVDVATAQRDATAGAVATYQAERMFASADTSTATAKLPPSVRYALPGCTTGERYGAL